MVLQGFFTLFKVQYVYAVPNPGNFPTPCYLNRQSLPLRSNFNQKVQEYFKTND